MIERTVNYRVEWRMNRKKDWNNVAFRLPATIEDARAMIAECKLEDGRLKNSYRIIEIVRTETVIE